MKNKLAKLARKFKDLKIGTIEVLDLKEELDFSEDFDFFDLSQSNKTGFSQKRKISAYASYATTSGCSDSCGSSTDCC